MILNYKKNELKVNTIIDYNAFIKMENNNFFHFI